MIKISKDSTLLEVQSGINAVLEDLQSYIEDAEKQTKDNKDFYAAKAITFQLAYDLVVSRLEFLFEEEEEEEI